MPKITHEEQAAIDVKDIRNLLLNCSDGLKLSLSG
jgi:hypothetical protein